MFGLKWHKEFTMVVCFLLSIQYNSTNWLIELSRNINCGYLYEEINLVVWIVEIIFLLSNWVERRWTKAHTFSFSCYLSFACIGLNGMSNISQDWVSTNVERKRMMVICKHLLLCESWDYVIIIICLIWIFYIIRL